MCRVAMLSVHGCPLDRLGAREAGGMQLYVRELSRHLGTLGLQVDVFTRLAKPDLPEVVWFGENSRVIHLRAGEVAPMDKYAILSHLPEFVCSVRRFMEREQLEYQFLHSHYWLSGWVGAALQRSWGRQNGQLGDRQPRHVPHAITFHTLGLLKNQSGIGDLEDQTRIDVERRLIGNADSIVVSTDHERQALVDLYGAYGPDVQVIPPGVDQERFRPIDRAIARAELGLGDEPVLVFVGRIDPVKGLDTLLRAVALLEDAPDLRLFILGGNGNGNGNPNGDSEARHLRDLASELGLDSRVSFVGPVEQELLSVYYSAADACVIPSHYESFGLVALEALACGTPVIAARVGGLPSIVQEGENGLLVDRHTPAGFAEAIRLLLTDAPLRARLRSAAPGSIDRFTWDQTAAEIFQLYHYLNTRCEPQQVCLCDH
ncbi:MAG TPA: glycosyltransferase [Chloroflexota bacterium]|nr:glycosyltransferase [Chloroflexota bacterium]